MEVTACQLGFGERQLEIDDPVSDQPGQCVEGVGLHRCLQVVDVLEDGGFERIVIPRGDPFHECVPVRLCELGAGDPARLAAFLGEFLHAACGVLQPPGCEEAHASVVGHALLEAELQDMVVEDCRRGVVDSALHGLFKGHLHATSRWVHLADQPIPWVGDIISIFPERSPARPCGCLWL